LDEQFEPNRSGTTADHRCVPFQSNSVRRRNGAAMAELARAPELAI
jgi:hypothetical protein